MVMLNLFLMRAYVWRAFLQLLLWSANICRLSYGTWPLHFPRSSHEDNPAASSSHQRSNPWKLSLSVGEPDRIGLSDAEKLTQAEGW